MPHKPKACFVVIGRDIQRQVRIIDYLANDVRILQEIGYEVTVADLVTTGIPFGHDLYFTWGWHRAVFPLVAARLSRAPFISTGNVHAVGEAQQGSRSAGWVNFLNRSRTERILTGIAIRGSDATLATAQIEYDGLVRLGARNLHLLYHGIDTEVYSPPPEGTPRRRQVLTVTHLKYHNIKRKRIREIIQAIPLVRREFPDVQFVIVGGWREQQMGEMNELRALAERVGATNSLQFPGAVDREEKIRFYRESAIYLQPTHFEGFGVAIAEAMACGLPVVTSSVGAVPEVVDDCGLYCAESTPREIAQQVCRLLGDNDLRLSLGRRSRERIVEQFSYAQRKSRLEAIIVRCTSAC